MPPNEKEVERELNFNEDLEDFEPADDEDDDWPELESPQKEE